MAHSPSLKKCFISHKKVQSGVIHQEFWQHVSFQLITAIHCQSANAMISKSSWLHSLIPNGQWQHQNVSKWVIWIAFCLVLKTPQAQPAHASPTTLALLAGALFADASDAAPIDFFSSASALHVHGCLGLFWHRPATWRCEWHSKHMEVFWNGGTPKSPTLINNSIVNHQFWGTQVPSFMETPIWCMVRNLWPCSQAQFRFLLLYLTIVYCSIQISIASVHMFRT